MTEEKMPTVVQALSAVMQDVRELKKTDRNEFQKFLFRGVDATMNAVGPALRKHGVVIVPEEIVDHEILSATTSSGKYTASARVKVTYRAYGPAGDSIPMQMVGEAQDTADKSSAKALSVAYRTLLLQAFTLPTDSPDPDHENSSESAPAVPPVNQTLIHRRTLLDNRIKQMPPELIELLKAKWVEAKVITLKNASTLEHLDHIKALIDSVERDYLAAQAGDAPMAMDGE